MKLLDKINGGEAVIGIVGLGYVGLPLARAFWEAGHQVIGFDVDPNKIKTLEQGGCYLKHLGERLVADMVESGRFTATTDFKKFKTPDAILICVPTPLGKHLEPDLSYVEETAKAVGAALRKDQLVVLESTTYPSTTRNVVLPHLTASGMECGTDFYVAYSPEREDPGRKDQTTQSIPKLVGGLDDASTQCAVALYRRAVEQVVQVSSAEVAESAKLLENIYRAVNIAMVNEMKVLLTEMDIDVWEVIDAASTKPFGFQAFYPGPGLGGHCIPIDPFYLTWKAREVGLPTRFIELAGQVNHSMPDFVVNRATLALNERGKAVSGANILVLGLAYKPDVDDVRESPSLHIIEKLTALGAEVTYNDPHIPATHKMRHHDLKLSSTTVSPATLKATDCVVVSTAHAAYDWQMIADNAPLIIDTRNALSGVTGNRSNIVMA